MEQRMYEETQRWYSIAVEKLKIPQREIPCEFTLGGKTAGMAYFGIETKINYNSIIAEENFLDFMKRTVPHEVAHIVAFIYFHENCGHGDKWKFIMEKIFECEDFSRTHNYDISEILNKKENFEYICGCGISHPISKLLHKKMQKGQIRRCTKCHGKLFWSKGEI